MKKLWLAVLLAAATLIFAACGGAPQLSEVETTVVDEEAVSFIRPAEWLPVEPVSEHGVCAFSAPDGSLSLEVVGELGAMEYYSVEELGAEVAETVAAGLFAAETDSEQKTADGRFTGIMRGEDGSGQKMVCRIDLFAPYPSVHYYLLALATEDAYAESRGLLQGVADSFTVTKSDEEMYQLIREEREAAAEQAGESGDADDADNEGESEAPAD